MKLIRNKSDGRAALILLLLILLCGDVESNPGPPRRPANQGAPSSEEKIKNLESVVSEYENKIKAMESELETTKNTHDKGIKDLEFKVGKLSEEINQIKSPERQETELEKIKASLKDQFFASEEEIKTIKEGLESITGSFEESQNETREKLDGLEDLIVKLRVDHGEKVDKVLGDNEMLRRFFETLEQRVKELKLEFSGKIHGLAAGSREHRKEYKAKFLDLDVEFSRIKERMENIGFILDEIQEKLYDFEQNKKNNLILYGVTGKPHENSDSLRTRILHVFKDTLNIRREIPITRATRMYTGPEVRGCRPVLITFENFKDRETILRLAKTLKKANINVTEDLSRKTRENRAELRRFMRSIKKQNPEKKCFLEYDKLYVDHKIYVWNDALGQVIEQAESQRYGGPHGVLFRTGTAADFLYSRPGTAAGSIDDIHKGYVVSSRPPSSLSRELPPKSASSIPRLPPLSRAVSMSSGMAHVIDPRDEKLNEMENIIRSYEDKLNSVSQDYQEKVKILENRLVEEDIDGPVSLDYSTKETHESKVNRRDGFINGDPGLISDAEETDNDDGMDVGRNARSPSLKIHISDQNFIGSIPEEIGEMEAETS